LKCDTFLPYFSRNRSLLRAVLGKWFGGKAMNDFVAAMLVLLALAAVGNFASEGSGLNSDCVGDRSSFVRFCR
jgi:hypothetical protein